MANSQQLHELCIAIVDCPHSTPKWTDSGLTVLRSHNIRGGRLDLSDRSFTDEEHFADRIRRAVPEGGDLVITREAPMGEVCEIPNGLQCCLGQRMVLIKPNKSKVVPRYLLFALQSPFVQHHIMMNEGTGSTVSNLRIPLLEALPIPTPALPEQQRIADILGTLDDKIELNRQTNETLEAMAKALFKSWFVDFDPVREKAAGCRPTGLDAATAKLFPASFDDSPLGPVPKGWKVCQIKDLTSSIQYGLTQSASTDKVGPHFLRITDIQGGNVNWAGVPYCRLDAQDVSKYRVKPGDIFVARTGASTGENIYIVDSPDSVFASYLVRFQFANAALGRVVGCFMRSEAYFDFVACSIGGSAQPNASAQVLASAQLVVPPVDVAEKFFAIAQPLDSLRYRLGQDCTTLAATRDALLPKLLSGEVAV